MIPFSRLSTPFKSVLLTTFALLPSLALGDIFVMKDGTQLKGKLIDQTYETYTLKVEIAENVLGTKTVKISDVKKILRNSQSELDFKKIKTLFPTKDMMNTSDYAKLKVKNFDSFYTDHPRSKHLKEVQELEKKFNEEHKIIKNGGLKLSGRLLTKDQIDSNRLEIMAIIEYNKIEKLAKSRKYISALRAFEKMEKSYQQTRPFRKSIEIVQAFLPRFKSAVSKQLSSVDSEMKIRERHIAALPEADVSRIKSLLKNEDEEYQRALLKAENETKTKWLPLNKYVKEPMEEVLKNIESETTRLTRLTSQELNDAGKMYRDLLQTISSKDYDASHALLDEFKRANPPVGYLTALKAEVAQLKSENLLKLDREKAAAKAKAEAEAAARRKKAAAEKAKKKSSPGKGLRKNLNQRKKDIEEASKL